MFEATKYYRTARYLRPAVLLAYWPLGEAVGEATALQDVGRFGFDITDFTPGFTTGEAALVDTNTRLATVAASYL